MIILNKKLISLTVPLRAFRTFIPNKIEGLPFKFSEELSEFYANNRLYLPGERATYSEPVTNIQLVNTGDKDWDQFQKQLEQAFEQVMMFTTYLLVLLEGLQTPTGKVISGKLEDKIEGISKKISSLFRSNQLYRIRPALAELEKIRAQLWESFALDPNHELKTFIDYHLEKSVEHINMQGLKNCIPLTPIQLYLKRQIIFIYLKILQDIEIVTMRLGGAIKTTVPIRENGR